VIDVVVMASIMRHVERRELSMLDDWADVVSPKFFTEIIPVVPLVCGNCLYAVEVPCEYLLPNLSVVWLPHRTVNILYVLVSQSTNAVVFTDLNV